MSPRVLRATKLLAGVPWANGTDARTSAGVDAAVADADADAADEAADADADAYDDAHPQPDADADAAAAAGARIAPLLRAYAHCARATSPSHLNVRGGVSVVLVNLAQAVTHRVSVANLPGARAGASALRRVDFVLTPASEPRLTSRRLRLNGKELLAGADGALPPLSGVAQQGEHIELPPRTFGFYVFPEAGVRACMPHEQQQREREREERSKQRHLREAIARHRERQSPQERRDISRFEISRIN